MHMHTYQCVDSMSEEVSGYTIHQAPLQQSQPSPKWNPNPHLALTLLWQVSGLAPSTTYQMRVRAHSDAGKW